VAGVVDAGLEGAQGTKSKAVFSRKILNSREWILRVEKKAHLGGATGPL
jgi:hypothetical protein